MAEEASHLITLSLDKQLKGEPVLKNPECEFTYHWDYATNMGIALLHTINGSAVNITLHPLGIQGQLDFMSDMMPTQFEVNAEPGASIALIQVTIYRVVLDMDEKGGNPQAAIMFNEDGSSITCSAGFADGSAARQLPEVDMSEKQL